MEATLYAFITALGVILITSIVLVVLLIKRHLKGVLLTIVSGLIGGIIAYFFQTETVSFYAIKGNALNFFIEFSSAEVRGFIGMAAGLLVGIFAFTALSKVNRHA